MVPRPDMIIVPEDATISAAFDLAIDAGVSRLRCTTDPDGDGRVGCTKNLPFGTQRRRSRRRGGD